jgi:hypothetical protein
MVDVYSFVEDIEFLAERIKSLEDNVLVIIKQTVECALFIQEYTVNGFCSTYYGSHYGNYIFNFLSARAVRNTWAHADRTIDDLSGTLVKMKDSFDSSLTVQGLFLSTKLLQKLDGLGASSFLEGASLTD